MEHFSETVQHTFLDYLAGGCELNFMVAIDFTGTNAPRLFLPSCSLVFHVFTHFYGSANIPVINILVSTNLILLTFTSLFLNHKA